MTIREIIDLTGLSDRAFSFKYGIPYRTIQNWTSGARNCPEYVLTLLQFKVEADLKSE